MIYWGGFIVTAGLQLGVTGQLVGTQPTGGQKIRVKLLIFFNILSDLDELIILT